MRKEKERHHAGWKKVIQCTSQECLAPMPGLKKELFPFGQVHDVDKLEEVKKKLARYVEGNFKHEASGTQ